MRVRCFVNRNPGLRAASLPCALSCHAAADVSMSEYNSVVDLPAAVHGAFLCGSCVL